MADFSAHTFTQNGGGAPPSLLPLQLRKPGVRYSAPVISLAGCTSSYQQARVQNEGAFRFPADEQQQQQLQLQLQQQQELDLGLQEQQEQQQLQEQYSHSSQLWSGVAAPTFGENHFTTGTFPRNHSIMNPRTPLGLRHNNNNNNNNNTLLNTLAPTRTRTATTTISSGKRSSTNHNVGECIMALIDNSANEVGVALCQLPSLAIIITQYGDSVAFAKTLSFIFSRNPVEILVPETAVEGKFVQTLLRHFRDITFTGVQRRSFDEAHGAHRLLELMSTDEACSEVSNIDRYLCISAANALIDFVELTYNYTLLPHTVRVQYLALDNYMEVSRLSARALQLIPSGPSLRGRAGIASLQQQHEQQQGSSTTDRYSGGGSNNNNNNKRTSRKTLFRSSREHRESAPQLPLVDALNHTITNVGRRLLRSTVLQPLRDAVSIELRYDSVEWLLHHEEALTALRCSLRALAGDDIERVISTFSQEPKVQTVKSMQHRIESVVALWKLLGGVIQLSHTLRAVLGDEAEERDKYEEKSSNVYPYDSSDEDSNNNNENENDSNNKGIYDGFSCEEQPQQKRRRYDGSPNNNNNHHHHHNTHPKQSHHRSIKHPSSSSNNSGGGGTTLLRKLLETLTVCRMEEICTEISLYLDESVVRVTERNGHPLIGGTSATQRGKRPGGAVLQVQQCFAVKPNLSGTLDAARYQYSQAVEAMFAYAEELKQQYNVGSLRVVHDSVRGYHFSYDARHECNAPESVFLQKYSGGNHYALYHSSRMMMMTETQKETENKENMMNSNNGACMYTTTPLYNESVDPSTMFTNNSTGFMRTGYTSQQHQQQTQEQQQQTQEQEGINEDNLHNVTKHQVRGRRVTCTTKEMLIFRRNADEAVTEILQTQDSLVRFLVDYLRQRLGKLQAVCDGVAMLDLLVAFAMYSRLNACTRPKLLKPDKLLGSCTGTHFTEARHPGGMTLSTSTSSTGTTTANTISWDANSGVSVLLLTGPNAAGKTTLLRQVGQLITLAQCGCLIPANTAALHPCDRLIAHMLCDELDDAMTSAFAKEMRELAHVCQHTTPSSVVLMDELGRRTAVREGTALAWAAVEFLVATRCRSVFVTHFSRLTQLARRSGGAVRNVHLAVTTEKDDYTTTTTTTTTSTTTETTIMKKKSIGMRMTCALRFEYRLLPGPSQVDHYGLRLAARVGFFQPALNLARELLPLMNGEGGGGGEGERRDESNDDNNNENNNNNNNVEGSDIVSTTTTTTDDDNNDNDDRNSESGSQTRVRAIKRKRKDEDINHINKNNDNNDISTDIIPRFSTASGISTIPQVSEVLDSSDSLHRYSLAL